MLRSCLLAAALTILPLAAGSASVATNPEKAASQPAEPFNIGFVLYTKTQEPGTLSARWNYANAYTGLGMATGGPASGDFVGRNHVRYYLESGAFSDEYDLQIDRRTPGDFYDVTWITEGKVSARGVGLEVADGKSLALGWRRVAD